MGISQARRSFVRRSDFWSFNLANWPPRQTDSQTVSPPHPRPLLLLAARAHSPPSQPLYGLLPNLLFFSPCVTSLHPSVTVLSSLILEFFFCFYLFIYFKEASSCSRFIVWSHCSCSKFASWSTVRMTCFHSLRDVWMKGIVRHNKPEPLF